MISSPCRRERNINFFVSPVERGTQFITPPVERAVKRIDNKLPLERMAQGVDKRIHKVVDRAGASQGRWPRMQGKTQ